MVDGIIFDMDGVLLDTESHGMKLVIRLAAERGYAITPEIYRLTIGTTGQRTAEIFQGFFGRDFPNEEIGRAYWEEKAALAKEDRIPKKPGVAECLAGLRRRGIPLALATSTPRALVETYLEHIPELRGAFDAVVCGTDVEHSKPAPDIFLRAAQRIGIAPERCLGVEDSRNGLKALQAAGIPSVMIPDLIPYEEMPGDLVTCRLSSLLELCPLVDKLNGKGPEA